MHDSRPDCLCLVVLACQADGQASSPPDVQAVHGNPRPSFSDLNGVAAHALASLLLPARSRPFAPGAALMSESIDTIPAANPGTPPLRHATNHSHKTPPSSGASQLAMSARKSASGPRMSPGMQAAQANSPAVLASIPALLGSTQGLADIVQQVSSSRASSSMRVCLILLQQTMTSADVRLCRSGTTVDSMLVHLRAAPAHLPVLLHVAP